MKQIFIILLALNIFTTNITATENITNNEINSRAEDYYKDKDYSSGIKYILTNYQEVKNDWYINYLLGEMALENRVWQEAQKGYARAIELLQHDVFVQESFHESIYSDIDKKRKVYWASLDGLGIIYYVQNNYKISLNRLEAANKFLEKYPSSTTSEEDTAKHFYNLACAYSLNKKTTPALKALEKSIKLRKNYAHDAQHERDFKSIRNHPEFLRLTNQK